jgi:hypothetical protein
VVALKKTSGLHCFQWWTQTLLNTLNWGDIVGFVSMGSILQNSNSAENFSDKFSASNFGQKIHPKQR